jgi:beta-galactosidase GanA
MENSRFFCNLFVLIFFLNFSVNGQAPLKKGTNLNPHPNSRLSPHLAYKNGYAELSVDDHPFLMTAGELGNSSASNMAYMKPIWPRLSKMHLNTLLAPVYWELLEPHENQFDFSLVDAMLADARSHNIKLVFLWFGTWKNSMSCYVPAWIKTDQQRFPRAAGSIGLPEEIITPFSKNALAADKKAFTALMRHIKAVDERRHTVLMIQVENEIGMLPSARDHSALADTAFLAPVPAKLMEYLDIHRDKLAPETKERWEAGGYKTSGDWEDIFGKSLATDEFFMAWYFGTFVDEIARAGKAVYDIPLYVNAALNAPGKMPGQYPSAGPLPHVIDIWKAAAPSIDFLSPDFYTANFRYWADRYTRSDNPLFIPEHRFEAGADAKALYAFGHYHALGFSPFSVESSLKPEDEAIGKVYDIIQQLMVQVFAARQKGWVDGVLLSKEEDSCRFEMGDYIMTATHELTLGWSPKAKDDKWPLTGGIIIGLSNDEFYVGGTGLVLTFQPKTAGWRAGILSVEEGRFVNGKWQPGRRMNGDQDHQGRHLRIPEGEYAIQRIKLYKYK